MKTVLGIDLGTQSIKAVFYDYTSYQIISADCYPLTLDRKPDGSAEQQTKQWVDALISVLGSVAQNIKDSVVAVGVSGQQHGFVALGNDDKVLTPVKLWCDTSTEKQSDQLNQRLGGELASIEKTGNKMMTGYTAPKILHLKQTDPALYKSLECILLPHDYLNYWLTGEKCMEMGDASGTGLLDVKNRRWSTDALNAVDADRDLSECLPLLRQDNEVIGHIHEAAAQATGLAIGTPVCIGGGDNMMAAIGTGNVEAGRTTISLGTSGTVYTYNDKPITDPTGSIASFCSSNGGWLPLLCTMNCTVTTELFRKFLNVDIEHFDNMIVQSQAGANGLLTLPFFNGERSPNLPNGKGSLMGITDQNLTPFNVLRSGLEGATFALFSGIQSLSRLGSQTREVTLTGGGSQSAIWRQITADIMGVPVTVMQHDEGAAYGAALQAYCAMEHNGVCDAQTLAPHIQKNSALSCKPRTKQNQIYASVYQRYLETVDAITPLYQQ